MSRSAVRVRSSAPQLRLQIQAFATGGTPPAPKLESTPDNNATAAGDRRNPRGRGWITIGRGGKRPAVPRTPRSRRGESGPRRPALWTSVTSKRRRGPTWWPGDESRPDSVVRHRPTSGVRRCAGPCRPRRAPPLQAPLPVYATHQTSCRYVAHQSARVVQFEAQCMGRFPT